MLSFLDRGVSTEGFSMTAAPYTRSIIDFRDDRPYDIAAGTVDVHATLRYYRPRGLPGKQRDLVLRPIGPIGLDGGRGHFTSLQP